MRRKVAILGMPMDLGQGRRGVDMGPSAIRYGRLHERLENLGCEVTDLGDVDVPGAEELGVEYAKPGGGLEYLDAIRVACEAAIEKLVALPEDVIPVVLGGDHSIAIGSVTGASRRQRTGVVWVDAHGDFNTPKTSPSGNIHGMPLATLCGLGDPRLTDIGWPGRKIDPEDVVLIGIRDLDSEERRLMKEARVTVYTMKEVDRIGLPRIAEETLAKLGGLPRLHVSFDADVLDPEIAPGVGTPVPGGLTYREAHLLMELFADSERVTSLDLVEVNPILDRANRTANTMVGLAASLLGKKIF
ncbi:MAG: arginase [Thermoanaerobaculia bacterium]